ncbi:MAG: hypothetical protein ABFD83_04660 [Armatimonadota bacterium]
MIEHAAASSPDGCFIAEVRSTVDRLLETLKSVDGYGYDTYDYRVGKLYESLFHARKTSLLCEALIRCFYAVEIIAPIAFRRLRGIKPHWDPMGNSYRAGAHMSLYLVDGDRKHLDEARAILDRIVTCAVGNSPARGFALGFKCITGSGKLWRTDVPVSHYSLRVARKLLMWERINRDDRYAEMLDEVIRFLTEALAWVEHEGMLGVGYTPDDPLQVINIWADVASLLASWDVLRGTQVHKEKALRLARGVLAHQQDDGTWPYFASWMNIPGRVDNSHTSMVLGALADIAVCYPNDIRHEVVAALEKGTRIWLNMFFDENTGKYWHLPGIKHQCHAVAFGDALYAITRLVRPDLGLSAELVERLGRLADKMVVWSLREMRLPNGRFCERKLPYRRYSVRSVRSFDGLIADALALYWARMQGHEGIYSKLWTV